MPAARRLARFVVGLRLDDVPSPIVARTGLLTLDTLGCCLAAARYDFTRAARATDRASRVVRNLDALERKPNLRRLMELVSL